METISSDNNEVQTFSTDEEKKYKRYDGICNYLLKILTWNYKEGRKFVIDEIDENDNAQLLILSLMDKLNKNLGYEIYFKGKWLDTIKVRHLTKINIKQYKSKEVPFVYDLNIFICEMCVNLQIEKEVLSDIYDLYYKEK